MNSIQNKIQYIIIEGNIGAGKTTLATKLAKDFNAKLLLEEFSSNPFLPKFYQDPDKYSFQLELSFLSDRHNQIKKEILNDKTSNSMFIADYSITKSVIFAKNTLPDDEFRVFQHFYNIVLEKTPRPDLYVYLHADTKKLKKNIIKRGREYETNISHEYLKNIELGYFDFIDAVSEFPILFIDINKIDFQEKIDNYDKLKRTIFSDEHKLGLNSLVL